MAPDKEGREDHQAIDYLHGRWREERKGWGENPHRPGARENGNVADISTKLKAHYRAGLQMSPPVPSACEVTGRHKLPVLFAESPGKLTVTTAQIKGFLLSCPILSSRVLAEVAGSIPWPNSHL